ncbi:MAG: hypothetical protein V1725_07605 [archaeon]
MSILKTAIMYGLVACVGWGAHTIYKGWQQTNSNYSLDIVKKTAIVTKKDEQLSVPADLLFENYKLTGFVKKQLDGFDKLYQEFKQGYSPAEKKPSTIERLLPE